MYPSDSPAVAASIRRASDPAYVAPNARLTMIAPWAILLAALACFLALVAWQGRLPHIDEVFYKAAGYHWAVDGRFAAPELSGRLRWDPPIDVVFACYPPLYPFVFGVYTNVVGFGWRQVAMFDALLHAALCLATAALVLQMLKACGAHSRMLPRLMPGVLACAAGLVVLPLGTIGRPDELAMMFGMGAVVVALSNRGTAIRISAMALLMGLCAATSVGAAVVIAPVLVFAAAANHGWRRLIGHTAAAGGIAAIVFAACLVPLIVIHPRALQQLVQHSADNTHDYFTWLQAWAWAFGANTQLTVAMAGIIATALLLGAACWRVGLLKQWTVLLGGALIGLAITFAAAKGKMTYLWFVGPWMIGAAFVLTALWWRAASLLRLRTTLASMMIAPMLLGAMVAGSAPVTQWLAVAMLPPGQTPADAETILNRLIPDGAVVLADDLWPHLAARCEVYEATLGMWRNPHEVIDRVQYVALTANFSGQPGQRKQLPRADLEQYLADNFEVMHDGAGAERLTFLGATVGSHAQGFGPVVLRRRSWAALPAE